MDERRERWLDQATRILAGAIALALILNGLPFWARRVGLVEPAAHAADLARFCAQPPPPWWVPATCRPHRRVSSGPPPRFARLDGRRLYRLMPLERTLKAARQALVPLLVVASAALLLAGWQPPPALSVVAPLLPLLLSTVVAAWISLPLDGALVTLAAAAPALWIPLAALAGWLTPLRRLRILADGAASLVLLQLPFLALEAMRGLPMPFGGPVSPWWPTRLSGLMNQPNSLGGLLALSAALCLAVSRRPWQRWPLMALALALALAARSGSGVVALVVLAAATALGTLPRRWRWPALLAGLAVLTLLLPRLLGRPQLYQSPAGRLGLAREWLAPPRTALEIGLGHGLASQSDPRGVRELRNDVRRALNQDHAAEQRPRPLKPAPRPEDHGPKDQWPKDHRPEDHTPEDFKPENYRLKDLRPEDIKPENYRLKDLRPEDIKPENYRLKDLRLEDFKPENYRLKDLRSEDFKPENYRLKDLRPENIRPENIRAKDQMPKDLRPENIRPEDIRPEDIRPKDHSPKDPRPRSRGPSGEGQPLLLLAQGGVVGLLAFYGLLGWCAWRDPLLRPFWAVLTLLSLTLNVTEVFPLGIWLAVATRRALGSPAGAATKDASGGQ